MSILPEGKKLRDAVKWISEERKYNQPKNLKGLVSKASLQFNLSPKEQEFLYKFVVEEKL